MDSTPLSTASLLQQPGEFGFRGQLLDPASWGDALELTVYTHAARCVGDRLVVDALLDEFVRRRLKASIVLSGSQGFGGSRRLRTENLESTWNDVPTVVIAVDARAPIEAAAGAAARLLPDGLVTLGRTQRLTASAEQLLELGGEPAELSIHCRAGKSRDDPGGVSGVLEQLARLGVAGATALGGGEGTIAGELRRTRLFARSPDVPVVVISVDSARVLAEAAPSLCALPQVELLTAKPTQLCKWRGRVSARRAPTGIESPRWRKLTLYTAGEDRDGRLPVHLRLLYRLRKSHAAGVTIVRGQLGYALGTPIRPDRGWRVRRKAPIVTTIVDRDDRIAEWFGYIDAITGADGLVTCEEAAPLGHDQV